MTRGPARGLLYGLLLGLASAAFTCGVLGPHVWPLAVLFVPAEGWVGYRLTNTEGESS